MRLKSCHFEMPGRFAPAFLFALATAGLPAAPAAAQGQPAPSVLPPPAMRPVPDTLELSRLIWSTIVTVNDANRSGNYTVLRDTSAQGFQINNDPARLAQIFAGLRDTRVDLSIALLVPPTYAAAPQLVQQDVFRVTGVFPLRPTAIQFDLMYQWEQGRWKLFGIDLRPLQMASAPPGQPAPQQAQPQSSPSRRR
jgi:hypothetical protein